MKYLLKLLIASSLLVYPARGQDKPIGVTLIQLLACPEKFDGKLVMVWGFLSIENEKKHGPHVNLYLHQEDAKNLLSNNVLVEPSEQMLKDQEKVNRIYVIITGVFRPVRAAGNDTLLTAGVIKDVRSCIPWSDPNRPIGLKDEKTKNN